MNRICPIAVRLTPEEMEFVERVAARLQLPTDCRLVRGRAVQAIIAFMSSSVGLRWLDGQGNQGQQCLQGGAA